MSKHEDGAVLWNLCRGALATRVAGIVAELRVADALAAGPRPVAEIAAEVGADADTLHRYLRALASEGIFAEVDPGGGNGSFLLELFSRKPGLRGVVYDLPETVRDESALAAAGIEFEEGSFFERVPSGDVYVLGTILHDWPDDRPAAILRTIREHAPAGAKVLILDSVVQPGNAPQGAKWLDILMLATLDGRERTEPEWRALIEGSGLRVDSIEDRLIQASCP